MKQRSYCSSEVTELAKSLINVQRSLQPALKDRENPFVKSRYATLNSVMDACRETLLANGIWVTQYPVPADAGHLGLVTKLTHAESGQWQSSLLVMPLPKADPQGYGSAITYARRYALSAMLGIVAEDDDDGEAASLPRPPVARQAKAPPAVPSSPSTEHQALASLPRLDGVTYSTVTAQDGRLCVMASGNTSARRQALSAAGFTWHAQRKMWWRYADSA